MRIVLFLFLLFGNLALTSGQKIDYCFRTIDIRNGLSQNSVNRVFQDHMGFMWIGTKDGLNRYDGHSFRIYNNENSKLGRSFITAFYEDAEGNLWIGTDGGVYIYHPLSDSFTAFKEMTDEGIVIHDFVTMIGDDTEGNIWISVENQGLFCFTIDKKLHISFNRENVANITCFWMDKDDCWLGLYSDNLYYYKKSGSAFSLYPFKNADGVEVFKNDIVNCILKGHGNLLYVATADGLTEVNLDNNESYKILTAFVRTLQFKSDNELWIGTETGLYIYNLTNRHITHITVSDQDDPYALADNAIYSIYRDRENGMWVGSYFGGVNYYPYQWTYFEKYYPRDGLQFFGRRIREICEGNDGTLWIGTEDKGLFNYIPSTGEIKPFNHPDIYKNIHGLCLDGDELWVGTFSGGLNRIDLRTKRVKHYSKENENYSSTANDAFSIYKTRSGDIWIGTTLGLLKYNRSTDDFVRISQMGNRFVYDILEDHNGILWFATYANGIYSYDVNSGRWKNYLANDRDSTSLAYNKVISIYEDSRKCLWFMTQGKGFCRYNPETDTFTRYDMSKGLPNNVTYKMVEDAKGNLWITTNKGLVCFNPIEETMHVYTTANGLLSNQFNFQSGFCDKTGNIYLGSINGLVKFNPETFREDPNQPPIVITDFYLFNELCLVNTPGSPLKESITYVDQIELAADQNSFAFQVAALSYQAPEMDSFMYRLEGFDREWYLLGRNALITYSNLPYGHYTLYVKGANGNGRLNDVVRTLHIYIRPPFYLTVWAYIVYVLLGLSLLFVIIRIIRMKASRRQIAMMEKFEREKERELYQSKIKFFTNLAHEIRTPLTLIKSPLENVLLSKRLPQEVRDDLETMDLNTNRLLELINQLLDFRKTESQGFQLSFVECNVTDLLRKICKRFEPLIRERGLTQSIEMPDCLIVSADKEGLTKMISNLLTNSVKYADSYIRIKLFVNEDLMVFEICNDGLIVPSDKREYIFQPFAQYSSEKHRIVSGTGIGLPLARSLAELHGGTLCMGDSLEENCFRLQLPIKHANTINVEQEKLVLDKEGLANEEVEVSLERSLPTVLIVEDSVEMQMFIVKQLSAQYHVLSAINGVEAIKVLEENVINLVISDIMMPEMDGLELCEYLKGRLDYSHIPFILLTAKTTLQAKIEGMKMGADAYIEKPFSVEYLKACVSNLLNSRDKLRQAFLHSPFAQSSSVAMNKADEDFLKKLKDLVINNMQNPDFCLDDMISQLSMSRSSLNRKIKGVLGMTPNEYIRLERLKKAAQLLKDGEGRVNEVCYMVGFSTPSYFAKCFRDQFGVLPKDFIKEK